MAVGSMAHGEELVVTVNELYVHTVFFASSPCEPLLMHLATEPTGKIHLPDL